MVRTVNNRTITFAAGNTPNARFNRFESIDNQLRPSLISSDEILFLVSSLGSAARFGPVPERMPGKLIPKHGKLKLEDHVTPCRIENRIPPRFALRFIS